MRTGFVLLPSRTERRVAHTSTTRREPRIVTPTLPRTRVPCCDVASVTASGSGGATVPGESGGGGGGARVVGGAGDGVATGAWTVIVPVMSACTGQTNGYVPH